GEANGPVRLADVDAVGVDLVEVHHFRRAEGAEDEDCEEQRREDGVRLQDADFLAEFLVHGGSPSGPEPLAATGPRTRLARFVRYRRGRRLMSGQIYGVTRWPLHGRRPAARHAGVVGRSHGANDPSTDMRRTL